MFNSLTILEETASFVAIDKPAGVPTIPDRFGSPSVHDQLSAARGERLWVVHRLDREVTGILLFARNAVAHRHLSMAFEQHKVSKAYEAWTSGDPPDPTALLHWESNLLRGKKRSYVHPAGKPAITDAQFWGVTETGQLRFVLTPQTGRNHQLRVHLANAGYPICGDALYGSPAPWRPGEIALRAIALRVAPGVLGRGELDLRAPALAPYLQVDSNL